MQTVEPRNVAREKVRPLPAYDMRPWWAKRFGNKQPNEVVHSMAPWTDEKTYDDLVKLASTMPGPPPASIHRQADHCDNMYNDMRISEHMDAYTSLATHTASTRHHSQRGELLLHATKKRSAIRTPKVETPHTEVSERHRWQKLCPYCRCGVGEGRHELWCVANDVEVKYETTPLRKSAMAGNTRL